MDKLFLLDAYALIYRSYYAFMKAPRINSKGLNTSCVMGFCNTLNEILTKEKPTHIAVAFDHGKTFRHEAFPAYKAQREETPEDIKLSVPIIKKILEAYHIPILQVDGFEADDIIGTVALKAGEKGMETYMLTPDKDYAQLVRNNVFMFRPRHGGGYEKLGVQEIEEKYSITSPLQVMLAVALVLSRIKLPDPRRAHEADTNEKVEEKPMRVMAFGFGMLTLFLYVAAQTGVNSFFINYAEESIHIEKQTASLYLAFGGMGLFFIGRLAGGVIMNYIQPRLVLLVCAILTFVATLIVVVCSGTLSLIAFFALYLGESIMFPTIFSLALRDAGTKTKLASSLLIMTIVGGAVAPVIMGYIADTTGSMAIAFLIPLVCYGVIGTYALLKRHVPL